MLKTIASSVLAAISIVSLGVLNLFLVHRKDLKKKTPEKWFVVTIKTDFERELYLTLDGTINNKPAWTFVKKDAYIWEDYNDVKNFCKTNFKKSKNYIIKEILLSEFFE